MIQSSLKSHRAARQSGKLSRYVKREIIDLAIMQIQSRRTRNAIREIKRSIETRCPGASRLSRNPVLVERFLREHNARVAKAG